jgi:type IV secretory pathway TraG/TraD family ATPase VirD4
LLRSYHLRVFIIIQDLSQLRKEYGEEGAKVFINSKVKIAFTQNDLETAKWISNVVGYKTTRIINTSYRIQNFFDKTASAMLIAQPLLALQDILRLPTNKAILIVEGQAPVLCQKICWDREQALRRRVL